jgi:hypothetical protein
MTDYVSLSSDLSREIERRYRARKGDEPIEMTPDEAWAAMGKSARKQFKRREIVPGVQGTILGNLPVIVVKQLRESVQPDER